MENNHTPDQGVALAFGLMVASALIYIAGIQYNPTVSVAFTVVAALVGLVGLLGFIIEISRKK